MSQTYFVGYIHNRCNIWIQFKVFITSIYFILEQTYTI